MKAYLLEVITTGREDREQRLFMDAETASKAHYEAIWEFIGNDGEWLFDEYGNERPEYEVLGDGYRTEDLMSVYTIKERVTGEVLFSAYLHTLDIE